MTGGDYCQPKLPSLCGMGVLVAPVRSGEFPPPARTRDILV
jgi:hypothetical protein